MKYDLKFKEIINFDEDIVKFIVQHTMKARHAENIPWGMLAVLGDARIRIRHAQILLDSMPGSVTDPR